MMRAWMLLLLGWGIGCAEPLVTVLPGPAASTGSVLADCAHPVPDHLTLPASVAGESEVHFYVADPVWALGLGWAAWQLDEVDGLGSVAGAPELLAVGLELTGNQCAVGVAEDTVHGVTWGHDPAMEIPGCFGVDEVTVWTEVCRMWPSQVDCADYGVAISVGATDNWANGALALGHFAVFSQAMWTTHGVTDPEAWLAGSTDPQARAKLLALGVQQSAFSGVFDTVLSGCAQGSLEDCVTETWLADSLARVGDNAAALGATEVGCYDARVEAADVERFLDQVTTLYSGDDVEGLRAAALAEFEVSGPGPFQVVATRLYEALDGARLVGLSCPDAMLGEWYGASCP